MMRLLLGGGGSGGHVFPGIAVARAVERRQQGDLELLYAGRDLSVEATIAGEAGIPFARVGAAPLRGRNILAQAGSLVALLFGVWDAVRVLRRFRPQAVLLTGGYASVPVGIAARLTRTPLVLYQPDIAPGWAVRVLSRLATRVCVTSEASLPHARRKKTVVTGYPLRPIFTDLDRPMARARFQLNGDRALLVTGAVQGAHSLNDVIDANLERLLALAQVIHVTGPRDAARLKQRRAALPDQCRHRYRVHEYLGDDLPIAMAACDLAISRAGASVLGEFPAAGLPAVLVPLHGAGGHQRFNAAVLRDAGAAVIVDDGAVATDLVPTVEALLQDPDRLAAMRAAASGLARLDAADRIAAVIEEVAQ